MGTLTLDTQAQALLKHVQRKTGPVAQQVEQAVGAACEAQQGKALTLDELEKVLTAAMPAQQSVIKDSKAIAQGYHCDGKNKRFLTSILDMRIEKEQDVGYNPPRPTPPISRDPLFADFSMAPDADFMLLFNARDVDKDGQPLLMKIVARERADVAKIDLTRYRTKGGQPDVQKIANNASFVQIKDTDEAEFAFGDPLKQVSLCGGGKELSTSVKVRPVNVDVKNYYYTHFVNGRQVINKANPYRMGQRTEGEALDTTKAVRFDERIHVSLKAKDTMPAGTWLDTPAAGAHIEAALSVDRGFFYEPGAKGSVSFAGAKLDLAVAADDAQLLGSPAAAMPVVVTANWTIRQLLQQPVSRNVTANPTGRDADNVNTTASELLYAMKDKITLAGAVLSPLADTPLAEAGFAAAKVKIDATPSCGDHDGDDTTVNLALDAGFLAAAEGASVAGFKIVVGYTDAAGAWVEAKPRTVGGASANKREEFSFEVEDFDGLQQKKANMEVRVFNEHGVPAQRVLIPFQQIGWALDD
jgi:hypothetical protein